MTFTREQFEWIEKRLQAIYDASRDDLKVEALVEDVIDDARKMVETQEVKA